MKRLVLATAAVAVLVLPACTRTFESGPVVSPAALGSPARTPTEVVAVVERTLPAVVNVVSETPNGRGEGTGFIVRSDGIVVTNWHVIENATRVRVLTSDEEPREFSARVIGGDIQADLAVLDIEANRLPTVPIGNSSDLRLGQPVVALGYSLGLEGGPSVTSGIVSSLTRRITVPDSGCGNECINGARVYADVIQTDAAINPGNSGGPLLDLAGTVVGINTAGTSSAENIGFAIQIDSVKLLIFRAADNPDEPVAFMGITPPLDASDPEVQLLYDLPVDEGALITGVTSGGRAARAGVRPGQVVMSLDGEKIGTADELIRAIQLHHPGDVVEVGVVMTDGTRHTVTVTLGLNPVALRP